MLRPPRPAGANLVAPRRAVSVDSVVLQNILVDQLCRVAKRDACDQSFERRTVFVTREQPGRGDIDGLGAWKLPLYDDQALERPLMLINARSM